jgi:hypothetical protein
MLVDYDGDNSMMKIIRRKRCSKMTVVMNYSVYVCVYEYILSRGPGSIPSGTRFLEK